MTKKFKPEKHYSVSRREITIAFDAKSNGQKEQTLSCVVFPNSAPSVQSDNSAFQDEYVRESDAGQAANYWDAERGEFIKPPTKQKTKSAEIERVREEIQEARQQSAMSQGGA